MFDETNVNISHLGFIQSAISRMASNAFQIKAWFIGILSAMFALFFGFSKTDFNLIKQPFLFFSFFIALLFFLIETYYLYLERGYVALYNFVIGISGNFEFKEFDMRIPDSYRGIKSYLKAMTSVPTGGFYFAVLIGLVGFYFLV